jgi:hypothetical protein
MEIKNALGQTVRTYQLDPSLAFSKTISVGDLQSGIYFVYLITSKGTKEQQFIKQ